MTALQKISASIKRKRNSLFEFARNNADDEEENAQKTLQEARAYMCQTEANKRLDTEKIKNLVFLCQMLENSLSIAGEEQQRILSARNEGNPLAAVDATFQLEQRQQPPQYTTWAAGGAQRQRRLWMRAKLENANAVIDIGTGGMRTIQEDEPQEYDVESGTEKIADFLEIEEALKSMATSREPSIGPTFVLYEETEPLIVNVLPHLAMVSALIVYMLFGAAFFRLIDPEIESKSTARAFIWSFQLLATIGWGDSHASTTFSQAFTVLYISLGIPMLFSVYANFGRLMTEFCCRQGPRLWARLFGAAKDQEKEQAEAGTQRLPLLVIGNLLALHQCVGLLIYSFWLKDWPVVSTIYFSITTMATSGFGDLHPDTDSWMETIVAVLYISVGIVLLSALFLTIALYYQTFLFLQLKEFFEKLYANFLKWKKVGKEEHRKEEEKS